MSVSVAALPSPAALHNLQIMGSEPSLAWDGGHWHYPRQDGDVL